MLLRACLVVAFLLPLAGCTTEPAPDPRLESFAVLYAPLGRTESGFSLELSTAEPQTDRDLQERLAYGLRVGGVAGPPENGPAYALDSGFQLVRQATCIGGTPSLRNCSERQLQWPDVPEPAPWGIGWTLSAPPGTERTLQGARTVLVHENVTYEYEGGRLAPDRIVLADDWGYQMVAYDVLGPLGGADDWPEPPEPLANETRGFLVHPDEEEDFLGLGWSTQDAMDHLAADPEAGPILRDGGCVLRFAVWHSKTEPFVPIGVPMLTASGPSVHVWLQDREGASTDWVFHEQGQLLGDPQFTDPEGDLLWPFLSEHSCEDRRHGPAARLSVADSWARSRDLVKDPDTRGYVFSIYHMPPDHGHGGFSPDSVGFEVQVAFFAADEGNGSGIHWDLLSGTLVGLTLAGEDGPSPG